MSRIERRLLEEGQRSAAFFQRLEPSEWDHPVYQTGSHRRVRQVLAHFVSAERSFARFLREIIAGGPGVPRDFDIDAFNETEVAGLAQQSPSALIEAFQAGRSETVSLVRSLGPLDLLREGYHPWFGDSRLAQMLQLIYRHNLIHLRGIRKARELGSPVPHRQVDRPAARSSVGAASQPEEGSHA